MKRSTWPKMVKAAPVPARGRRGVGSVVPNGAGGARAGKRSDGHSRVLELGLERHGHQTAVGRREGIIMARRDSVYMLYNYGNSRIHIVMLPVTLDFDHQG